MYTTGSQFRDFNTTFLTSRQWYLFVEFDYYLSEVSSQNQIKYAGIVVSDIRFMLVLCIAIPATRSLIYTRINFSADMMSENSQIGETKSLSTLRIVSIIFLAFIEAFLFGYIMDGWPSIEYMLRSDGVYSNLCSGISTDNQSIIKSKWESHHTQIKQYSHKTPLSEKQTCVEQDAMLNMAYLISNSLGQGSAWLLGCFFDKFGLLISRTLTA